MDESIQQYTDQLLQVEQALAATDDPSERANLKSLKRDLTELLHLTRETIEHEKGLESAVITSNNSDEEFALFMAEINAEENESSQKLEEEAPTDMLKDLVGSKCSAPHIHKWGSKSHHNALICSIDTTDDTAIMVKVLFINPTHQEMVPCSYFLEGECKFSDEKCRYSHGEVVPFIELKDYQEPRFEQLQKKKSSVLAKQKNRLWVKGIIKDADFDNKTCRIQLEENKLEVSLPFEEVLPLDDNNEMNSDSSSNSDSDDEDDTAAIRQTEIITRSLLNPVPTQRLGEWEKHTKGIGSRIMQRMGYVIGAGLGCRGEGIVVPVSAQVLPQRKSLDYCMELREKANGDKDLFSVEKKILRQRKIQEKRTAKQLARSSEGKKDVFSFINDDIFGQKQVPSNRSINTNAQTQKNQLDLPSCSSKNLNIARLKLSEQTRRLHVDIEKLAHSLKRHQPGSQVYKHLQKQIVDKRGEIALMQATESSISREQQLRSDKLKMTVF